MVTFQANLRIIRSLCHKQANFFATIDPLLTKDTKQSFMSTLTQAETEIFIEYYQTPAIEYVPVKKEPKEKYKLGMQVNITKNPAVRSGTSVTGVYIR